MVNNPIRNQKRKTVSASSDLRVVLSGVTSWAATANIVQTVTLTNLWQSWSLNTVLKVYLPAWLTFVSSPHGVHSGGVITWDRGTLKDAFTDTFVVTGTVPDDYEIVATVTTDTYDPDPANNTDTHMLTLEAALWVVEIRSDNVYFPGLWWPWSVTSFVWSVSGNLMPIFIEDIAFVSGTVWRLWYLTEAIPAQGIDALTGQYAAPYDASSYFKIYTPAYDWSAPIYTINTEWEPF